MEQEKTQTAETKKKAQRTTTTTPESIILMAAVIIWLVICVRGGSSLPVPMLITWAIIYLFCKIRKIDFGTTQSAMFDAIRQAFGAIQRRNDLKPFFFQIKLQDIYDAFFIIADQDLLVHRCFS